MVTWLHDYMATWLHGYMATWLQATWLHGYMTIWLHGGLHSLQSPEVRWGDTWTTSMASSLPADGHISLALSAVRLLYPTVTSMLGPCHILHTKQIIITHRTKHPQCPPKLHFKTQHVKYFVQSNFPTNKRKKSEAHLFAKFNHALCGSSHWLLVQGWKPEPWYIFTALQLSYSPSSGVGLSLE